MRAYVLRTAAAVTSAGAHRERERRRKSPERGEYMKMYDTPQELSKYLNIKLECDCGRTHYVPIKGVEIGADAIERLPHYVKSLGYAHPLVLCDEITYKIAGARCMELMQTAGIAAAEHTLTHLGFDEATLGEIVINKPDDCDLIIGVGTGSITDMTRYSSFKLKLPCFTVATGAPMDGFAASIGIMNVNNLKATMPAHCTEVIIGDTDILKTAPYRMTVAGFGDLIGKLTCLNDWELARIINGEHYCHNIVTLVRECVADVMKEAPKIKQRDPETLGSVMRGLVLSGAAISLYGDSRPASGAEHHMSHYWETILEQRGIRPAMHGEQVAVGTVLVLMLIEELLKENIDFDAARESARAYNSAAWELEIRAHYGAAADEVIALEQKAGKNNIEGRLARIDSMQRSWDAVRVQLETLPESSSVRALLRDIGCPCTPADIGVDDELLMDTFCYCKEIRARYTVFQTVYDLGLTDKLAARVIEKANSTD